RIRRERHILAYDLVSNSNRSKCCLYCSDIDARQGDSDGLTLPNITSQPKMLDADFRSMGGIEFVTGKLNDILHVARLCETTTPSDDPQPNSRGSQSSGKSDKPQRKVSDGIASRLLPEPVILAFLTRAFDGLAIEKRKHYKKPEGKEN